MWPRWKGDPLWDLIASFGIPSTVSTYVRIFRRNIIWSSSFYYNGDKEKSTNCQFPWNKNFFFVIFGSVAVSAQDNVDFYEIQVFPT